MLFSLESLAAVATIAGTLLSILALIPSHDWFLLTAFSVVAVVILTYLYVRREQRNLTRTQITIEGYSIDALNVANLRRRVNRTLYVQEAHHAARIEGGDLTVEWTYSGYCRTTGETAMDFSVESEHSISFAQLDCMAYDLRSDPEMKHGIRPLLVGADGVSKKLSVPFLKPLAANESFGIRLRCTLPHCMKSGFGYYSSTLSFAQERIPRCSVSLTFVGSQPHWVRVYEPAGNPKPNPLKTLAPTRQKRGTAEYIDVAENIAGQSTRIYCFWRDEI